MTNIQTRPAQYFMRFGEDGIPCNQYALSKLGIGKANCSLKIGDHYIAAMPFQMGFKRSFFLAPINKGELEFYQRHINSIISLSIVFAQNSQRKPLSFFIRCNLISLRPMQGREDVGIFMVDYRHTPDDLAVVLGEYLENQERIRNLHNDYSNSFIKLNPETSKKLGYNNYATIIDSAEPEKRIQAYRISTKTMEHLESDDAPLRAPGQQVVYQLYFNNYMVSITGTVASSEKMPQGFVKTVSTLSFCPELIEIIGNYWSNDFNASQWTSLRQQSRTFACAG